MLLITVETFRIWHVFMRSVLQKLKACVSKNAERSEGFFPTVKTSHIWQNGTACLQLVQRICLPKQLSIVNFFVVNDYVCMIYPRLLTVQIK